MGAPLAPRRLLVGTAMLAVLTVGALTNAVLNPTAPPRLPQAVDLPAPTSTVATTGEPLVRPTRRAAPSPSARPRRTPTPARTSVVAAPRPYPITTTTSPAPVTVVSPQRPVLHLDGSTDSSTDQPESGDGSGG